MATLKTANGRGKYHDLNSRQDLISFIVDPKKLIITMSTAATSIPLIQWGIWTGSRHSSENPMECKPATLFFHSNPLNWVPIPRPPTSHRRSPPAWAPNIKPCLLFTRTSSICTSTRSSTRSAMWMATDTGAQSRSSTP